MAHGLKARLHFVKGKYNYVQVSELGNITGSNPTFSDIVRKSKGRQMKHLRIKYMMISLIFCKY
jgi:hypothetical protein